MPVLAEEVERGLGDLRPAVVDGQGVPPVRELDELGDGLVLPVRLWQADETRVRVEVSRSPEARRTRL